MSTPALGFTREHASGQAGAGARMRGIAVVPPRRGMTPAAGRLHSSGAELGDGDPDACYVAIGLVGSGAGRPINAIVRTGQVACFRSGECERERRLLTVATAKRPASTPQTSRHRRLVLAERERDKRGPALLQIVRSESQRRVRRGFRSPIAMRERYSRGWPGTEAFARAYAVSKRRVALATAPGGNCG
jgi:hypothetical protein